MRIVCSYCQKDMGTKEPAESNDITHSMCQECFDHFDAQWSGMKLGEYLDRFQKPVLVVNGDRRVIAINDMMGGLLGKTQEEILGLRGGEAMECEYARLPGGCGQAVHCQVCTIRNTVVTTLTTGEPAKRVQAYLPTTSGQLDLRISTSVEAGSCVLVQIDEIRANQPHGKVARDCW